MKEVTIKVPENKLAFLLELADQLGFEVMHEADIPEDHKAIVRDRVSKNHPDNMKTWESARKKLKFK